MLSFIYSHQERRPSQIDKIDRSDSMTAQPLKSMASSVSNQSQSNQNARGDYKANSGLSASMNRAPYLSTSTASEHKGNTLDKDSVNFANLDSLMADLGSMIQTDKNAGDGSRQDPSSALRKLGNEESVSMPLCFSHGLTMHLIIYIRL